MQSYGVKPVTCERIQNFNIYNEYFSKKQVIAVKNIPALPSTQVLAKGGVNSIFIDKATNEFYLWHCAANINDIMGGKPLKKSIDASS